MAIHDHVHELDHDCSYEQRLRMKTAEGKLGPSALFPLASNKDKEVAEILAIEPLLAMNKTHDLAA